MWLPRTSLTPEQTIEEFDRWVTPTLGTVRETVRFQSELDALQEVVEGVSSVVLEDGIEPFHALTAVLLHELRRQDAGVALSKLISIFSFLFLATAKSDNAVKCQYPLDYRRRKGDRFPRLLRGRVQHVRIPDVLKAVDLAARAVQIRETDEDMALDMLADYSAFLLADAVDRRQFAALITSYAHVDSLDGMSGRDLLAPLVAFQVRGSVAASGGHDPEAAVRGYLEKWGLRPSRHFNTQDATAQQLNDWLILQGAAASGQADLAATSTKTRAFDFILPFLVSHSPRRIFVQSQFYAGDSGSVSHKNVDQAAAARKQAAALFPDARFVELVDGAGYCASLRRDLKHLLFAPDTDDFFQLRSIPVRLRRMLQESGVLSPLDLTLLVAEGIADRETAAAEIASRVDDAGAWIDLAVESGWLDEDADGSLTVAEARRDVVDEYGLLDRLVSHGESIVRPGDYLLIPGFGPAFGVEATPGWEGPLLEVWTDAGVIERWTLE